ncbi:MAG: TlpA family protein disulfide reductase [Alkalicoccus sp.]|nr:MAG: TlpA family protein disulfide reductase [Alkalicoccus sp.]
MNLHATMPELAGVSGWLNSDEKEEPAAQKPVLIHFWSVSCPHCMEAIPELNKIRDDFERDLEIIAVHVPLLKEDINLSVIKEAVANLNIIQPVALDNQGVLADSFEIPKVPAYYVFDSRGRLRHFQKGGRGIKMLRRRIERVLDSGE